MALEDTRESLEEFREAHNVPLDINMENMFTRAMRERQEMVEDGVEDQLEKVQLYMCTCTSFFDHMWFNYKWFA